MKIRAYLIEEREKALYLCSSRERGGTPTWVPRSVVTSLSRKGHPEDGVLREIHATIDHWWCSQPSKAFILKNFEEI